MNNTSFPILVFLGWINLSDKLTCDLDILWHFKLEEAIFRLTAKMEIIGKASCRYSLQNSILAVLFLLFSGVSARVETFADKRSPQQVW